MSDDRSKIMETLDAQKLEGSNSFDSPNRNKPDSSEQSKKQNNHWDEDEIGIVFDKKGNILKGYTIYRKLLESIADNKNGVYMDNNSGYIEISEPDYRIGKEGEGRDGLAEGQIIPIYEVEKYYRIKWFICKYIQVPDGRKLLEHDPRYWGNSS